MSSLIPGYEYDIFISYRQKDNKGDGWVSEFVESLKTELESTFKEEISVYFDINPHDGLLETHDVDESLKEKLKCLVFIPIISRTYCDPKSFAWEHEFKAFVDQASNDQFGLKIKLPNGNVASRVLPIQIHDLEDEDQKLCESVLEGVLRGIEFIYKEPGIDKPLAPDDDEKKNLNNTKYKLQIVKVAHAIKEIITALQKHDHKPENLLQEGTESASEHRKSKTGIIAGSVLVLALIILGIIFIPKLFKPEEEFEKTIAVLPFRNDSPDPENEYVCNGIMEEILTQLQQISALRVKARTSVERYRDMEKDIRNIGRELDVSMILEGSVRKVGDDLRITAQLIDTKSGDHLWAETYDGKYSVNIFDFESSVAKKVAASLNAVITPQEEERIDAIPTTEMQAHDLTMRSNDVISKWRFTRDSKSLKVAFNLLDQALKIDPEYIGALSTKSMLFSELRNYDSALFYVEKIKKIDPENPTIGFQKGTIYFYSGQPDSSLKYFLASDKLNPNEPWTKLVIGQIYCYQKEEIIKGLTWFQQAIDLGGGTFLEVNLNIAPAYLCIDYFSKAEKYLKNAISISPECPIIQRYNGVLLAQEKYDEALHFLDSICSITACEQQCNIGRFAIHTMQKEFDRAEEYFNKAVSAGYTQDAFIDIYLAYLYDETGRSEEASLILNKSIEQIEDDYLGYPFLHYYSRAQLFLAAGWAILGDNKKALDYLSEIEAETSGLYEAPIKINTFPGFDNLRNEPEFKAILKRIEHEKDSLRAIVMEMEKRGELTL